MRGIEGWLECRRLQRRSDPEPPSARARSAVVPAPGRSAVMCNRQNSHRVASDLVVERVREVVQHTSANAVVVHCVGFRLLRNRVDTRENFKAKRIRCNRVSFKLPQECTADLALNIRGEFNCKATHSELRRALASVHGTACVRPERSSFLRFKISVRHSSATLGPPAPSRLSRRATTSTERSSGSSVSASASK